MITLLLPDFSGWNYADGMTSYLKSHDIRIFDFSNFSQPLTEQVRQNAQRIADENGIEIEFIRKLRAFRKDDRIRKIATVLLQTAWGLDIIYLDGSADRMCY